MTKPRIPGPDDCVAAAHAAEKSVYTRLHKHIDSEHVDIVHRLTRYGKTSAEIAVAVRMSERNVERLRKAPAIENRVFYAEPVGDDRAHDLEALAGFALHLAVRLRDEDPTVVWETLRRLPRQRLQELIVILAAAVPIDRSAADLLGWVSEIPVPDELSA